jgi:hypothetical protein
MLEVLGCMEAINTAIGHHFQGKPGRLTLVQVVRTRTSIQKRMLLLPTAKEFNINTISSLFPNLYECYRRTALIFSAAVIFPVLKT